jgi:hypothetical protein
MFKRIVGIAVFAVLFSVLFSCSSDNDEGSQSSSSTISSSSGGGFSSSEDVTICTQAPCGDRIVIANFNGTAVTKFGTWAYVYAEDGATIGNDEDTQYGGYIGMVASSITGCGSNKAAYLKDFDATEGSTGIGIELVEGRDSDPTVGLDTLGYFQYKYKGAAHHFRLQTEPGVFWMQKFPASADCIEVTIDINDTENFIEGVDGLGAYNPAAVTSIQWVPDSDINITGTLAVDDFYGYAR